MTFIDFFAGVGGFRRGMELAGHECIGFCEFDKFAVASYTSMHLITEKQREYLATLDLKKRQKEILKEEYRNGEWYANDIRDVRAGDIPKADCWCFGKDENMSKKEEQEAAIDDLIRWYFKAFWVAMKETKNNRSLSVKLANGFIASVIHQPDEIDRQEGLDFTDVFS